jgi:hypothetical protein
MWRLVIDTARGINNLNFTQPIDSVFYSGAYTVKGDRLKAGEQIIIAFNGVIVNKKGKIYFKHWGQALVNQ